MTSKSPDGESSADGRGWRIDVVLLVPGTDSFLLHADGTRLACPSVTADHRPGTTPLGVLVEELVEQQWRIPVSYLGMLAFRAQSAEPGIVVVAASARRAVITGPALRELTLTEVLSRRSDLEHADCFTMAQRWRSATISTFDLGERIRRAIASSIDHLARNRSLEDGQWGWSLYLDGNNVGLLSTAEAVLAHTYAREHNTAVADAVRTLESLQNTDGGWRIGRSLVGGTSVRSVVESTSECLLALAHVGRSGTETVRHGVRWLEDAVTPDGGWASVAGAVQPSVFPTTMAVRALSRLRHSASANGGVAWLRSMQQADGGWGATAPGTSRSEPAYTAYVVVALLDAGVPASDDAVRAGCEYLSRTFVGTEAEPWRGVAANNVIQDDPPIRLDYRHFATPWAVVALCGAGRDLGDPVVLDGLLALLNLRNDDGSWRCAQAPAGLSPVWATHDAVLALSSVVSATWSHVRPVALDHYLKAERDVAEQVIGTMLSHSGDEPTGGRTRRRPRLLNIWLSALSVVVILVALGELGVLRQIENSTGLDRALAAVGSVVVTAAGAVAPGLVTEEYRIFRRRKSTG